MSITSETRRESYESVQERLPRMQERILSVLKERGAMTAEEIMREIGTSNPNCVRPRLTELSRKGRIRASEKKMGGNGRKTAVWEVVTDAGVQ